MCVLRQDNMSVMEGSCVIDEEDDYADDKENIIIIIIVAPITMKIASLYWVILRRSAQCCYALSP